MKFSFVATSLLAISSAANAGLIRQPRSALKSLPRQAVDAQTSLTLDPSLIGPNLAKTGIENGGAEAGQVASATSTNNFINFCLGKGVPITNGEQVVGGSCNPIPMGVIVAKANMPSSKFQNPKNGDVVAPNTEFTIQMAISKMQTGAFVNPNVKYFSAPQNINGQGIVIGHSHVVVEKIESLDSTTVLDPNVFAFFKGLNAPASNGVLSATVTGGLPAGVYRLSSINTDANHTPILVAVAQHGCLDDVVYFTVGDAATGGNGGNGNNNGGASTAATSVASVVGTAAASSTAVATAATSSAIVKATSSSAVVKAASSSAAVKASSSSVVKATPTVVSAKTTLKASTVKASATAVAATTTIRNNGGNGTALQKFAEALGGIKAPIVTPNGNKFAVTGNNQDFNDLQSALRRSCDVQNNLCANAFNSSGGRAGFSIGDCNAQQGRCLKLVG